MTMRDSDQSITGILIQARMLEARLYHEDERRAVWTVCGFAAGFLVGVCVVIL